MAINLYTLLVVTNVLLGIHAHSYKGPELNEDALIHQLLDGYNAIARPAHVGNNDTVQVRLKFKLQHLKSWHEDILTVQGWLHYAWDDPRFTWDPSRYFDMETVALPSRKLWTPDIVLYNYADDVPIRILLDDTLALVEHTGDVSYIPIVQLSTYCHPNTSVNAATTTCTLKFGSWMHSMNKLDLVYLNDSQHAGQSVLENYQGTSIVSADVIKHVERYNCCPEAFTDVSVYLELDNRSFA